MRFPNVEDFNWKTIKDNYNEEIEHKLIEYNINDIKATKELWFLTRGKLDKVTVNFPGMKALYSENKMEFRKVLSKKYGINLLNANDVKIGEEVNKYIYLKLSKKSWEQIQYKRTFRQYIYVKDLIPEYIRNNYRDDVLKELLVFLDNFIIDVNKPELEYKIIFLNKKIHIKLGGLHSEDEKGIIIKQKDYIFVERDSSSMYPTKIISAGLYPEHLGEIWLQGYKQMRDERIRLKPLAKTDKHIKMETDTFKLGLNGGGSI